MARTLIALAAIAALSTSTAAQARMITCTGFAVSNYATGGPHSTVTKYADSAIQKDEEHSPICYFLSDSSVGRRINAVCHICRGSAFASPDDCTTVCRIRAEVVYRHLSHRGEVYPERFKLIKRIMHIKGTPRERSKP
jgi:hypothetical protein